MGHFRARGESEIPPSDRIYFGLRLPSLVAAASAGTSRTPPAAGEPRGPRIAGIAFGAVFDDERSGKVLPGKACSDRRERVERRGGIPQLSPFAVDEGRRAQGGSDSCFPPGAGCDSAYVPPWFLFPDQFPRSRRRSGSVQPMGICQTSGRLRRGGSFRSQWVLTRPPGPR